MRKTSSAGDDVAYIGQLYERRKLPGYSTTESVYRLIADGGVVGELAHAWNSNTRVPRFFFKDHQGSIAYEIAGTSSSGSASSRSASAAGRRRRRPFRSSGTPATCTTTISA